MEGSEEDSDREVLDFPTSSLGLHVLYEPANDQPIFADVVAVHGLGGDSFTTWTHKKTKKLWLRDCLSSSTYFSNTRILTFGYDARQWIAPGQSRTHGRVFTFAEELLAMLKAKRALTAATGRPIVFIGHSLGGIVIKKALVIAQTRRTLYGDIYESTKSITFLATPHQGADIATWATYLGKISKVIGIRNTAAVAGLKTWSESLLELSREFSELLPRLMINSFYETKPYKKILVVNEGSACLNYPTESVQRLEAHHRSICKYEDEKSPVYTAVLEQLEVRMIEIQAEATKAQAMSLTRSASGFRASGILRRDTDMTAVEEEETGPDPGLPALPSTPLRAGSMEVEGTPKKHVPTGKGRGTPPNLKVKEVDSNDRILQQRFENLRT